MANTVEGHKKEWLPAAFSIRDAAIYSSIPVSSLYLLAKQGRFSIRKIGKRSVIMREDLDAMLASADRLAA